MPWQWRSAVDLDYVLDACDPARSHCRVGRPSVAETRFERIFPADGVATSTKTEAPALVCDGTVVILATVNGTAQAALRVDSGATDVVLPRTTATRLISAGSLTHTDYVTTRTYRLADGSLRSQKVYRLRSLQVGALIVHGVPCTISKDGIGLLGQMILSKARDWAMDNHRHVLTLDILIVRWGRACGGPRSLLRRLVAEPTDVDLARRNRPLNGRLLAGGAGQVCLL